MGAPELYAALRLLGFSKLVKLSEVEAAWQKLALTLHPDYGGDSVEFQKLLGAVRLVRKELSQPQTCVACKGSGKDTKLNGWVSVSFVCGSCGGSGTKDG